MSSNEKCIFYDLLLLASIYYRLRAFIHYVILGLSYRLGRMGLERMNQENDCSQLSCNTIDHCG